MHRVEVIAIRKAVSPAPIPAPAGEAPAPERYAVDIAVENGMLGGQMTLMTDSATEYEVGKVYDLALTPAE